MIHTKRKRFWIRKWW